MGYVLYQLNLSMPKYQMEKFLNKVDFVPMHAVNFSVNPKVYIEPLAMVIDCTPAWCGWTIATPPLRPYKCTTLNEYTSWLQNVFVENNDFTLNDV